MSTLQHVIEAAGHETRSYSGRGMYGMSCLGVSVDSLAEFLSDVFRAVAEENDPRGTAIKLSKEITGMSTDAMGRGMILYWRGIPFEGDGVKDEADEDSEETV